MLTYIVEKEKGGQYYVHSIGSDKALAGRYGDKKHAIKYAAKRMGISTKEYVKLRRDKSGSRKAV